MKILSCDNLKDYIILLLCVKIQKGLRKLAILLHYKSPGMLYLAFLPCSEVPKMDFQNEFSTSKIKNHHNLPGFIPSGKKKLRSTFY